MNLTRFFPAGYERTDVLLSGKHRVVCDEENNKDAPEIGTPRYLRAYTRVESATVPGFQVIKVLGFYFYPGLTGLQTAIFSVDVNYLKWQVGS